MVSLPPVTFSKLPKSMLPLGREAKKSIKSQMQWKYIGLEEKLDVSLSQE